MSIQEKKTNPNVGDASKKSTPKNMFEGKVVSLTGMKLVMTNNKDGKEYSHTLTKDTKLTCDDSSCKCEDMKAGSKIRVTTHKDDRNVITCVEALSKNADFKQCN